MELTWGRPRGRLTPGAATPGDLLSEPAAVTERPWLLLVGENEAALEASAFQFIASRAGEIPVISPPGEPPLPIAVHELPPPGISGERVLYAKHLERAFFDTLSESSFSASSPLYLLPKLTELAAEGAPLTFVATARE
ncbi:MAG: hypothetical protein ACRD21_17875, partial [Vicinamibacteria bacterium]